jgi:translation initiation factor IF-1
MSEHVDTVAELEPGEYVRVETDTATTVDARVTGRPYASDTRVRVGLSVDTDDGDYRLEATRGDGEWTPVELRRSDRGSTVLASMGEVVSLDFLGESKPESGESASGESADVE